MLIYIFFYLPLIILIGILIGFVIKIMKEIMMGDFIKKNNLMKNSDNSDLRQDTIISMLDTIDRYHKTLILTKDMFIYMDEYQLSLIMFKDYIGQIYKMDNNWYLKANFKDTKIDNLFEKFYKVEDYIKDKLKGYPINRYLILTSVCMFNEEDPNIKILRTKNYLFEISNYAKEKIFKIEEIDELFEGLKWEKSDE